MSFCCFHRKQHCEKFPRKFTFPVFFVLILEREEFIRYFLGKGLQQTETFSPYGSKAKASDDDIEQVYGVSLIVYPPLFSLSFLIIKKEEKDYQINLKRVLTMKSMQAQSTD